jgi:hypothetical protein
MLTKDLYHCLAIWAFQQNIWGDLVPKVLSLSWVRMSGLVQKLVQTVRPNITYAKTAVFMAQSLSSITRVTLNNLLKFGDFWCFCEERQ